MEKLSCFVFLKLSRSLLKKRSGDLTAISGTLAPTWLSQRDRGGSGGTRLQKAGTSGSLQPVLPTDHHGSAELCFVQTDGWTNSLQRTVKLLFWVKVPVTHRIYLDSPTQAAEPPCEEGSQREPPRPSWRAGAARGARGGSGSKATGRDKKDHIKSSGQSGFHFSSGLTSHVTSLNPNYKQVQVWGQHR